MCPFSGDEALQSTRKNAACKNGVSKKDRDFCTSNHFDDSKEDGLSFVYSQNDPNNPLINNLRSDFLTIRAFQSLP
jgi:hypothetical protein